LQIRYSGEGDSVQFKMFEGLSQILRKNSEGVFEGQLEIQNLDDAIFSYDIIVHKKDGLGNMTELQYGPESKEERHFIWVGNKRNISFFKADKLSGELIYNEINSINLKE
jgi:hypothetical protein